MMINFFQTRRFPCFFSVEKWVKLNSSPRCFGARDDKYSAFTVNQTGVVLTMKLVRLSGWVTCDKSNANGWNYWGCNDFNGNQMYMTAVVTNSTNFIVLPNEDTYTIPEYNTSSSEIVYPRKMVKPLLLTAGQEYRVWFSHDLRNSSEFNNNGTVCVDVFGLYE